MRILLDSNIVLDLILRRAVVRGCGADCGGVRDRVARWRAASLGADRHLFCVTRCATDLATAFAAVDLCLRLFVLLPVDQMTVERARQIQGNDFEDAIVIACAAIAGVDALVTRDRAGFAVAPMTVLTPGELLARL